jgi:catechol 2,3-dioxygenase-like lactoylglutathione lyase family enzyme
MDMKLEVLVVPATDVDRAKRFYQSLGFRLDVDYVANEDFRIIQFTPPGSAASIIIGKGITSAQRGSIDRLVLAVYDIEAARDELLSHGVEVSEVFHDAGGDLGGGFYAGIEARPGCRSPTPYLRLVCLIQRSRRQRLAAAGDQGAAPGPGCDDGRCGSRTAPA